MALLSIATNVHRNAVPTIKGETTDGMLNRHNATLIYKPTLIFLPETSAST